MGLGRIDLHLRHGLVGGRIEGGQVRLRSAQLPQVGAGGFQAPVLDERWAVAPGELEGAGGGFDGGLRVAGVPLDPSQQVQGVGVELG